MTTEFTRSLLRVALAQICQNLGWQSVHSTPMEILTDVLERYINRLGRQCHRYSEQCKYFLGKQFNRVKVSRSFYLLHFFI